MKVLILSPYTSTILEPFIQAIESTSDQVAVLAQADLDTVEADLIVLYGHRQIIRGNHLNRWIVNCHTAFLPWNRGASPNLWSWYDNTTKGVTIHEVDSGIDTGPILAQRVLVSYPTETLETSYKLLQARMGETFRDHWPDIRAGKPSQEQIGVGSHHTIAQSQALMERLPMGWDTPCHIVEAMGREDRWERHDEAVAGFSSRRG